MRGTIKFRGKTYSIRFDMGLDPSTGKRKQKRIGGFKTKKEAEKALAQLIADYGRGELRLPSKQTVAEFLREWISSKRGKVSENTLRQYTEITEMHLIPALGNLKIDKLSPWHVQRYISSKLSGGRLDGKGGNLSPSAVHYHYRVLRAAMNSAVRLEVITKNPVLQAEPPKLPPPSPVALTDEQFKTILKAVQGTWLETPVVIAVNTGMRLGEVLGLRWKNVDFGNRAIYVVETLKQRKCGQMTFGPPKNQKPRTVDIPDELAAYLERHKAVQEAERLLAADLWCDMDLVCCTKHGYPLNPPSVSSAFRKLAHSVGVPVSFHDLRDAHAAVCFSLGANVKQVAERFGHSDASVLLNRYTAVLPTIQKTLASKIKGLVPVTRDQNCDQNRLEE